MNKLQRICFSICSLIGLFITGLLGYFGEHMPLRLIVFSLALSAITLFMVFFLIDRWLKKHH